MSHVIDKSNPRTSPFVFKFGLTCINCKLCNNRLKPCILGRTWNHVDMTTFMFISKQLFTDQSGNINVRFWRRKTQISVFSIFIFDAPKNVTLLNINELITYEVLDPPLKVHA